MKRIRKAKKGLDSVSMKRSIQEQLAKEMGGMNSVERLAYIKRQVQDSPFADAIKSDDAAPTRKADNF